jgi:anti-sigma B factor antagonist
MTAAATRVRGAADADAVDDPAEFALSEQRIGVRVILAVRGEIDLASVGLLEAATASAIAAGVPDLWIDLTDADFMDSTGVNALLRAHHVLADGRGRLTVICPEGCVRRTLEVAGVAAHIALYGDRAAAAAPS